MATTKQVNSSKTNIQKAQPAVHKRAKPGTKGEGQYFRIVLRPKNEFVTFRNQDVGKPGGLLRLAGRRTGGTWGTQAWLVSKEIAHRKGKYLVADNKDVQELLNSLGSKPIHEKGDIFTAKDRPIISEDDQRLVG